MSKKRRTKEQKIKTAQKQHTQPATVEQSLYSIKTHNTKHAAKNVSVASTISEKDYSFVIPETKKTILIVTALIVANILLAALIKQNIINLPF